MKTLNNEITETAKMLREIYKTMNLSRKQAAEVLNISTATLDRMKKNALGPVYIKNSSESKSNNGGVFYTVRAIAEYIYSNQMRTH